MMLVMAHMDAEQHREEYRECWKTKKNQV